MNLILIETSGNQRFIFATNKLRENVGASELTYRVGTQFVLEAVGQLTKRKNIHEDNDLNGRRMRANLLDKNKNPELGTDGNKIEVITATSSKALLLVEDAPTSRQIVRAVTERALREMPGLTVHGAISEDFSDLNEVHKAIGEVHRKLERVRYEMPGNEQRFLRLPFVAPCATSGLPAKHVKKYKEDNEAKLFSDLSFVKREERDRGYERIESIVKNVAPEVKLIEPEDIEKCAWVAVIHADGNGLGKIFLGFDKHSKASHDGRKYIEAYRRFSLSLDVCTINAAGQALKDLYKRFLAEEERKKNPSDKLPVVPLILGGDDLTVLCDGQYALKFVYEFLKQFEKETHKITGHNYLKETIDGTTVFEILEGIVHQIAFNAFDVPHLGICAGIAIVKPHFPFHQAYDLAESLLKSAKQVKERIKSKSKDEQYPCSALDYHVLYDSTASGLSAIRDRLKADGGATWLFARPYIVSEFSSSDLEKVQDTKWLMPRKWSELDDRVATMSAKDKDDDNKRKLPNSQLHTLREALFLGKEEADARTRLVNHRYDKEDFGKLLCEDEWKPSLFFSEKHDGDKGHATHFLDALDIVEFRKGEKEDNGKLIDKRSGSDTTAEQPATEE